MADWDASADRVRRHKERQEAVRAQMKDRAKDRASGFVMPEDHAETAAAGLVKACGGGKQQMQHLAE